MVDKEVKPLTGAEVDIFMCRLQAAMWENDKERIDKILSEVRERAKELGIIKDRKIEGSRTDTMEGEQK